MKTKIYKCLIVLLGLVVLQQGIALGNGHVDRLARSAAVIEANDIDPSALFYMESRLALAAEKRVRSQVTGISAAGAELKP